jgi:hypothetical protein
MTCRNCKDKTNKGSICDACWESMHFEHSQIMERLSELREELLLGCEDCGNDTATNTVNLCLECLTRKAYKDA